MLAGLELLLEALALAALEVAGALAAGLLAPDSTGVSPPQEARPKVMRAAKAVKILTFFINLSVTIRLRFLSF